MIKLKDNRVNYVAYVRILFPECHLSVRVMDAFLQDVKTAARAKKKKKKKVLV